MCEWGRTAITMNKLYTRQVIRGFHIFGSYLCFLPCYFSIWLVCDPPYTLALPHSPPPKKKSTTEEISIYLFFSAFTYLNEYYLEVFLCFSYLKVTICCVILSFLQPSEGKGTVGCTGQGTLVLCKHKEHHFYLLLLYFIALF